MNDKISALMDGELDREEAARVIRSIGSDATRRDDWDAYHVIGACLRGDAPAQTRRCREAIFERLANEPTVLAPGALMRRAAEKKTRIALAMAASIVTVSAVSVVALKQQAGTTVAPVELVQKAPPAVLVQNVATKPKSELRVNDYLVLHRQFSHDGALQNAALVQPVSEPARPAAGR